MHQVRDVLRALLACDDEWHRKSWGPGSSEVLDLAGFLSSRGRQQETAAY